MTAPTRSRGKSTTAQPGRNSRAGNGSREDRGLTRATRPGAGSGARSSAAERAYARRAQRAGQLGRTTQRDATAAQAAQGGLRAKLRPRLPRSRTSFVLLIMAMLAGGVVITLWLSTQAIAGSYKLERLHERNADLTERVAQLQRVVTKRESATWLAEQARELGMVPGGFPAKLVVHPDGSVTVVGEPKKVTAPPPPPAPAPTPQERAGSPQPQDDDAQQRGDDAQQQAPDGGDSQDTVQAGAGG